jgi:lysophospholipase L1-like esterase
MICLIMALLLTLFTVNSAGMAQPTPREILLLGSSTTGCSGPSKRANCYVELMKAARPSDRFTVLARGGTTLALNTPAQNWTQTPIPAGHDIVVIQLGINDWARELAYTTFRTHVEEFLGRVRAANPDAKIYWMMPWIPQNWPGSPDTWWLLWQNHGVVLANALRPLGGELIDLGPTGSRREAAPYSANDGSGMHYNDAGHRKIADAVLARI